MYSLVRGRLPLMRGRKLPLGSATPGRKRHQRNEVAPVERQRHDLLFFHVQAHLAAGGLQQRSGRGDFDGLRRLADFELHIQSRPVGQRRVMPDCR